MLLCKHLTAALAGMVLCKNGSDATVEGFTRLTVSVAVAMKDVARTMHAMNTVHIYEQFMPRTPAFFRRMFSVCCLSRAVLQESKPPTRISYSYKESALVKAHPPPPPLPP